MLFQSTVSWWQENDRFIDCLSSENANSRISPRVEGSSNDRGLFGPLVNLWIGDLYSGSAAAETVTIGILLEVLLPELTVDAVEHLKPRIDYGRLQCVAD